MQASFAMKTENYIHNKIKETKYENVEFEILSTVKKINPDGSVILAKKVLSKKGTMSLRDLGFPEKGEELLFTLDPRGTVLDVSGEEPGSIFYLPFFIFPKKEVERGETWEEEFQWNATNQPFTILTKLQSRFVGMQKYNEKNCLRVDFKALSLGLPQNSDMDFNNSSEGYYLWHKETNHVLYAETHFLDMLSTVDNTQSVTLSTFKLEDFSAKLLPTNSNQNKSQNQTTH